MDLHNRGGMPERQPPEFDYFLAWCKMSTNRSGRPKKRNRGWPMWEQRLLKKYLELAKKSAQAGKISFAWRDLFEQGKSNPELQQFFIDNFIELSAWVIKNAKDPRYIFLVQILAYHNPEFYQQVMAKKELKEICLYCPYDEVMQAHHSGNPNFAPQDPEADDTFTTALACSQKPTPHLYAQLKTRLKTHLEKAIPYHIFTSDMSLFFESIRLAQDEAYSSKLRDFLKTANTQAVSQMINETFLKFFLGMIDEQRSAIAQVISENTDIIQEKKIQELTSDDIKKLETCQLTNLNNSQIREFLPSQIKQFNPNQLKAFHGALKRPFRDAEDRQKVFVYEKTALASQVVLKDLMNNYFWLIHITKKILFDMPNTVNLAKSATSLLNISQSIFNSDSAIFKKIAAPLNILVQTGRIFPGKTRGQPPIHALFFDSTQKIQYTNEKERTAWTKIIADMIETDANGRLVRHLFENGVVDSLYENKDETSAQDISRLITLLTQRIDETRDELKENLETALNHLGQNNRFSQKVDYLSRLQHSPLEEKSGFQASFSTSPSLRKFAKKHQGRFASMGLISSSLSFEEDSEAEKSKTMTFTQYLQNSLADLRSAFQNQKRGGAIYFLVQLGEVLEANLSAVTEEQLRATMATLRADHGSRQLLKELIPLFKHDPTQNAIYQKLQAQGRRGLLGLIQAEKRPRSSSRPLTLKPKTKDQKILQTLAARDQERRAFASKIQSLERRHELQGFADQYYSEILQISESPRTYQDRIENLWANFHGACANVAPALESSLTKLKPTPHHAGMFRSEPIKHNHFAPEEGAEEEPLALHLSSSR